MCFIGLVLVWYVSGEQLFLLKLISSCLLRELYWSIKQKITTEINWFAYTEEYFKLSNLKLYDSCIAGKKLVTKIKKSTESIPPNPIVNEIFAFKNGNNERKI